MQIMAQNRKCLVNSEFVNTIYIEDTPEGARLMADVGEAIILGSFDTSEHAEAALKFIGVCLVDEDAQNKITQVPSSADMKMKDTVFEKAGIHSEDDLASALSSLLKSVLN